MNSEEPTNEHRTGIYSAHSSLSILTTMTGCHGTAMELLSTEALNSVKYVVSRALSDGREYSVRMLGHYLKKDDTRLYVFQGALLLLTDVFQAEVGEYIHPLIFAHHGNETKKVICPVLSDSLLLSVCQGDLVINRTYERVTLTFGKQEYTAWQRTY